MMVLLVKGLRLRDTEHVFHMCECIVGRILSTGEACLTELSLLPVNSSLNVLLVKSDSSRREGTAASLLHTA